MVKHYFYQRVLNRRCAHRSPPAGVCLFVAEGGEGIDVHGSAGGEEGCQGADGEDDGEDEGVVGEVAGSDPEEKAGKERRH